MPWFEAGENSICSTRVRRPGSFCMLSVAELPAARHPTACTQEIESRKLNAVTSGLGSIDQEEPFQLSMNPCGWNPEPPPPPNDPNEPTAQHCTELRHEMLLRIPGLAEPGTDADTSVQAEPSQRSMRIPDALPLMGSVIDPDAQQSVAVAQRKAVEVPAGRTRIRRTRRHRPRRAVPVLDQPLVRDGTGEDGEEVGALLGGARVAHRPAVVGREALHGRQLIVGLSGGPTRHDVPRRAVPMLDDVVEIPAVVVGREPTAKQFDDDVQLTLCRIAPTTPAPVGVGLGTMDQDDPFQFSISVPVGLLFPLSLRSAPTAQQSDPPTQEMSNSPPPSLAGSCGCAPSVQAVPFEVSTSGENVPLELMFSMVIPTPQHWVALAQVDPRRTSSAPVSGVVATYQPEDVAPAPT